MKSLRRLILLAGAGMCLHLAAAGDRQTVPVYRTDEDICDDPDLLKQAEAIAQGGQALDLNKVREQLKRPTCELTLPGPSPAELKGRDVWQKARSAFVRIGYYYAYGKGKKWQLDLSGGFFLTPDGVAVTAHHVVTIDKTMRKGILVAVDDRDKMYPVTEILAANKATDVCILRLGGVTDAKPLALSEDASPGDRVYCFSDPMGERSFFSSGMLNRWVTVDSSDGKSTSLMLDVSTDWAPGSSGSAVLDEKGNAIGLVSTIFALQDDDEDEHPKKEAANRATWMVIHEAVSAHEILALVKK